MDKRVPMRTCIGCNACKPRKELIRIVRQRDGVMSADETGRMNGRGAYLCRNRSCFETAVKKKGFCRTFKTVITEEETERLREEVDAIVCEGVSGEAR
ncbi:MAG: YlxR family protein [Lachnospiraceae bacterium]|nr:YlxR family protein [Lachnospiraceae bacterium]